SGEGVCDVAGGRGDLSFELFTKRGIKTTLIDPREPKLRPSQRRTVRQPRLKAGVAVENESAYGIDSLDALAVADSLTTTAAADAPSCHSAAKPDSDCNAASGSQETTAAHTASNSTRRNPYDREAHLMCPHIRAEFGLPLLEQR